MAFDGSEFRGLNDDIWADGAGSDDAPLDTFAEQALRSNNIYLGTGYDMASVPFYGLDSDTTPTATERVFASINKSRALYYPILLTRGVESVTFTMMYTCEAEDTGGSGVDVELRLVKWNTSRIGTGQRLGTTSFSLTSQATYTDTEQTVSLNGPWLGRDTLAFLEVWIESDDCADTASNITAAAVARNTIAPSVALTSLETYRTQYLRSDETSLNYDISVIQPGRLSVYPDCRNEDDDQVFSVREMWYLRIRSCALRVNYSGELRSGVPGRAELGAQRSVRSTTSIAQAASCNLSYTAPRHMAFGPAGEASPEETSAHPWYVWRQVASGSAIYETQMDGLLQGSVTGDENLLLVLVWNTAASSGAEGRAYDVTIEAGIDVLNAGDTSWSSATSIAASPSVRAVYDKPPTDYDLTGRMLYSMRFEDADRLPLRDSASFERETDTFFVTIMPINLNTSANPTRSHRPARLKIAMTRNAGPNDSLFVCSYALIARGRT